MVAFGGFDCWLHHLITKREIDSLIDSTDNPQFTYLSIYDIYFQFQTMVSQMVWERTSSMVLVNRCSPLREVWRHVTKLAKFLDLNNRSWDWDGQLHRRTIEEKYRLRFCSLLQSCTENSYMSIFSCFFLPNLQDHSLLRSRSVLPLQRDVMTSTLYCPSNSISNQSKIWSAPVGYEQWAGGLELIRNSETFWMNSKNVYMMSKNVEIWGLLSNLLTMHHREFASRFASRTLR